MLSRFRARAFPSMLAPCLLLGALTGCQSYTTGVEVICQAPVRCTECQEAPPELRAMKYAEHLDRLVRNGQANALLDGLASMDPLTRVETLRREAEVAGLTSCPLADYFEEGMTPPGEDAGETPPRIEDAPTTRAPEDPAGGDSGTGDSGTGDSGTGDSGTGDSGTEDGADAAAPEGEASDAP